LKLIHSTIFNGFRGSSCIKGILYYPIREALRSI